MKLIRLLLIALGSLALLFLSIPSVTQTIHMVTPSVVLALLAIAAVAAVLASAYHPALFSWRQCTGTPFDDSNASFMTCGKGKGMGGDAS